MTLAWRLLETPGSSLPLTVHHWIAKSIVLSARTTIGKKSTGRFHKFETGSKKAGELVISQALL
ncbi:hypothetical protein [Pseudomonas anguilliseptica]|uniref:hypothetical protein n=1 Tax=Pseudomonas anguilliseptica TaxID=53406 RepID=UPI001428C231|nr:hypothetical protein [Pseudomonas anguilliseptica]